MKFYVSLEEAIEFAQAYERARNAISGNHQFSIYFMETTPAGSTGSWMVTIDAANHRSLMETIAYIHMEMNTNPAPSAPRPVTPADFLAAEDSENDNSLSLDDIMKSAEESSSEDESEEEEDADDEDESEEEESEEEDDEEPEPEEQHTSDKRVVKLPKQGPGGIVRTRNSAVTIEG